MARVQVNSSLEVVSEADLRADAGAGGEAARKNAESELTLFSESVAAADLRLQLAETQIEVAGHAAKQLGAEAQARREVAHQRTVGREHVATRGFDSDESGRVVAGKENAAIETSCGPLGKRL